MLQYCIHKSMFLVKKKYYIDKQKYKNTEKLGTYFLCKNNFENFMQMPMNDNAKIYSEKFSTEGF